AGNDRTPPAEAPQSSPESPTPDAAFAALPRLTRLRGALTEAHRSLAARRRSRWGEPAVFFFDPGRQAELEAARPRKPDTPTLPPEIPELIAAELPVLFESVEARRAARTIRGLGEVATTLAPHVPAAKDLADVLTVPDDETVLVIHPASRSGFRLLVRGIA